MSKTKKTGVLLVNLGTPDAPTSKAVRKYLFEFLHDHRVVNLTRWLWCPILHGIILRVRPPKVAKLYQSVWTEEGAPLLAISKQQTELLRERFAAKSESIQIELAMTYGNPSIASGFDKLSGCDKIIVLPLYPQYSSATTASVFDRVAKAQKQQWNVPEITVLRDYYNHPLYIQALAESVESHWQTHQRNNKLLISFHGIPKRYATNGDPYPEQCAETARLLAKQLGLNKEQWQLCYQSRFGREEWLKPYTDETMETLGAKGESVDVICPGFSADCLETLEEIQEENREIFLEAGGKSFSYIPCLNSQPSHIDLLAELVRVNLPTTDDTSE